MLSFEKIRKNEVNVEGSEQAGAFDIARDTVLQRNPVAVLIQDTKGNSSKAISPASQGGKTKRKWASIGQTGDQENVRDSTDGKVTWTLHMGYSNKDFKSSLEVKISTRQQLSSVIEWVEKRNGETVTPGKEAEGGRWAPFTAQEAYLKSGYRDLIMDQRNATLSKRLKHDEQAPPSKKDQNDNEEMEMGKLEDDDDDDSEEDEEATDEKGFAEVEQLLSVLIFNGYLRRLPRSRPPQAANSSSDGV